MAMSYAAPGKVILFGEHFVVHGGRAIMCAIDRMVVAESEPAKKDTISIHSALESATLSLQTPSVQVSSVLRPFHHMARALCCDGITLRLHSDLPVGAGLGSSSACCVAAAGSIASVCGSSADVLDTALAAEKSVYPNSSGADCAACVHGGILSYTRGHAPKPVDPAPHDMRLIIADSGTIHNTPHMVSQVRDLATTRPGMFSDVLDEAESVSSMALNCLAAGDVPQLGRLASENQALLERLGVSNDVLRYMIHTADKHSYGSKITGAGGGGCIVAISDASNAEETAAALTAEGYATFEARIGPGAHITL